MLKKPLAFGAALMLSATAAIAQDFPSKPVTLMMPYAAGGPGDIITRTIGNGMSKVLKAQDRKSTRLNSSHMSESRMPSSA